MKGQIQMKYSEYHAKPKKRGNTAFFIVLACCLLAIGGASWFAAANISGRRVKKDKDESSSLQNPSSFISSVSEPPVSSAESVGKSVSDEPYQPSSAESASKAEQPEEKPAAAAYTMPIEGDILKNYSEKELQYSATYGDMRIHTGIDIACEAGTMISACGAGTVTEVAENAALVVTVVIDHGNGISSKYAAVKDVKVKAGQKVAMGDIIGSTGSVPNECADQSHLHFEVLKNGHAADPLKTLGLK